MHDADATLLGCYGTQTVNKKGKIVILQSGKL